MSLRTTAFLGMLGMIVLAIEAAIVLLVTDNSKAVVAGLGLLLGIVGVCITFMIGCWVLSSIKDAIVSIKNPPNMFIAWLAGEYIMEQKRPYDEPFLETADVVDLNLYREEKKRKWHA